MENDGTSQSEGMGRMTNNSLPGKCPAYGHARLLFPQLCGNFALIVFWFCFLFLTIYRPRALEPGSRSSPPPS